MIAALVPYNTLVVAAAVAAVGLAAGMVGALAVLRRRALAGDAAAHGSLAGVATAFLATGRRDLGWLLVGGLVTSLATLAALVAIRRWTRTRDDAAMALVLGVSFGAGVALVTGITARGLPDSAGLEQFLLGHTAGVTAGDAALLAVCALGAAGLVTLGLKELTLVAFDEAFAAAAGWPVGLVDLGLVGLIAVMVVVGLPAAGAVLVTALLVIPPVAARQWTDRVGTMVLLAGLFGTLSALVGVVGSALVPRLPTGPVVVLAAAALAAVSAVAAPGRGWWSRRAAARRALVAWREGDLLASLARGDRPPAGADGALRRALADGLVARGAGGFTLTAAGTARAADLARRREAWARILATAPDDARAFLTVDLPDPAAVIDGARLAEIRSAAERCR
ncbi:MAG: metal ABC transporter permease [Planctomycetes bacterium]|nr:metal ABC transporter permease [Planctomycetota bacterium]